MAGLAGEPTWPIPSMAEGAVKYSGRLADLQITAVYDFWQNITLSS